MSITISQKFLTVNGKRVGVVYDSGPWVEGVNPALVKIRPRRARAFPPEFKSVLALENNSESREDYFEPDCIRLLPGHPAYAAARAMSFLSPYR